MRTWFRNFRHAFGARRPVRRSSCRPVLEGLEQRCLLSGGTGFVETPLVSNIPGLAAHTDPDLINPWGFIETPQGQFRVAANGAGNAPLITAQGDVIGPAVVLPPPPGSPPHTTSAPNGAVLNTTGDFVISFNGQSAPATALFSTEDGTIIGWNPQLSQRFGVVAADQSSAGAVYKMLAMGRAGGANYLYATNFHNGTVDVFDKNFALHTFFAGQFTDPNAPAEFAPFSVANINGILFVTYAKQNAAMHDDVAGPGNGFIDEFDTGGHFLERFASGTAAGGTLTALNSPFGMTIAPAGFGSFGGDLLVGNFGDSHVSAFDLKSGGFLGQLQDTHGQPLVLDAGITGAGGNTKGLWGIAFGNGQGGAGTQTLSFASGPNDETDGVFGMVVDPPESKPATAGAPSHSSGHTHELAVDIRLDVADVQADVQALTRALATGTSAAVTADLKALSAGLSAVRADVAAGRNTNSDLDAMITAQAKLTTDLGAHARQAIRHRLSVLGKDLTDLRMDLTIELTALTV
jgi:uncharacterized protein (TIGR03118 family)